MSLGTAYCSLVSISCPCTSWIDDNIKVEPTNGTYIWLYDNSNITASCNYTIQYISYASLDLIQIYASILATTMIISGFIFTCMLCYIISFWIERRSRNSRRVLRYASY